MSNLSADQFLALIFIGLTVFGIFLTAIMYGLRRSGVLPKIDEEPAAAPAPPAAAPAPFFRAIEGANNAAPEMITFAEMMRRLQRSAPHLMIVGESGSGKSTLAMAFVCHIPTIAVNAHWLVLDPHAAPGDWCGATVVGGGRNFRAIEEALGSIQREMQQRYDQRSEGAPKPPPLYIVVDEVPAIAAKCESWSSVINDVAAEGRKVDLYLIILTQSPLVEALGIRGRGDTRSAFAKLLLGAFAAKVAGVNPERPLALETLTSTEPVIAKNIPLYASLPTVPRPWVLSSAEQTDERTDGPAYEAENAPAAPSVRPFAPAVGDKAALVAALVAAGWGATDIRAVIKGENGAIGNLVKQAMGEGG